MGMGGSPEIALRRAPGIAVAQGVFWRKLDEQREKSTVFSGARPGGGRSVDGVQGVCQLAAAMGTTRRDHAAEHVGVEPAEDRAISALSRLEAALRGARRGGGVRRGVERAALERDCDSCGPECDTLRREGWPACTSAAPARLGRRARSRAAWTGDRPARRAGGGVGQAPWAWSRSRSTAAATRSSAATARSRGCAGSRPTSTAVPASCAAARPAARRQGAAADQPPGGRRALRRLRGDQAAQGQLGDHGKRAEDEAAQALDRVAQRLEQLAAALETA